MAGGAKRCRSRSNKPKQVDKSRSGRSTQQQKTSNFRRRGPENHVESRQLDHQENGKSKSRKRTNGNCENYPEEHSKTKWRKSSSSVSRSRSGSSSSRSFESYKNGPRADADNHLVYWSGDIIGHRYQILSTIGEGTFGKVVLCMDKKSKEKVALKVIKRVDKYFRSAKIEIDVLKEILKRDPKLQHRCVRLLDHFDYHGFMCLSFEELGVSVYDFLNENEYVPFPMEHVKAISYQLIDSVAFLHRHRIIHTDLKPENILFVNSDWENVYNRRLNKNERRVKSAEVRLIDFGSATYAKDSRHSTVVSTRHYRALEVILELGWDEKCDAWSVGAIMFELHTGDALFQTHDNWEHLAMMKYILGPFPQQMVSKTRKRKYFRRHGDLDWDFEEDSTSNCRIKSMCRPLTDCIVHRSSIGNDDDNKGLLQVIQGLLAYQPSSRLSMRRCLKHGFFDSVRQIYQVK